MVGWLLKFAENVYIYRLRWISMNLIDLIPFLSVDMRDVSV